MEKEKKTINITVTPTRYTVSVDTYSVDLYTKKVQVKTDPVIDSLRTSIDNSALARLVDKYTTTPRNSNYTIKVSSDGTIFQSVKDLPGRSDDTVKDRFLRWLRRRA